MSLFNFSQLWRHKNFSKYSEPVVRKLFKLLHQANANIDDYDSLMKWDISYMLDNEKSFKAFFTDSPIELLINSAVQMFRQIAMGRRNSLRIGSRMVVKNVTFI